MLNIRNRAKIHTFYIILFNLFFGQAILIWELICIRQTPCCRKKSPFDSVKLFYCSDLKFSIDVLNFFSGKTPEESETYIQICKQIETLYKGNPTK